LKHQEESLNEMADTSAQPRVILSEFAWNTYGEILRAVVPGIEPLIVTKDSVPDLSGAQIGFVTRDIYLGGTRAKLAPAFLRYIDILRTAPDMKWAHIFPAGADSHVYVDMLKQGVRITSSAGANSDVVAHSALSGLLALARSLPRSMDAQRRHAWEPLFGANEPRDLLGQRAVVIGLGPIGQEIGKLCHALGLSVVGVRQRAGLPAPAGFERSVTYQELPSVLPQADWLILCCPLSDITRGMIDAAKFALLPDGAQFINVARGEVVAQDDMLRALKSGNPVAAYLDVFAVEPLPADSEFWDLPNVIISAHSAAASDGHGRRVARAFAENLRRWIEGEPLLNETKA
jgi:D-2-hydroxyacid dehydrogenase (NADP+)